MTEFAFFGIQGYYGFMNKEKINDLLAFSLGMINGENGKELIEKYKKAIETITPHEMIALEEEQLRMGIPPARIKKTIGKVINSFYKSLSSYDWGKPEDKGFLYYLMEENRELEKRLREIKSVLKEFNPEEEAFPDNLKRKLTPLFVDLLKFDAHYVKKENILFPYLEKFWDNYRPLKVMWSLHDDIRKSLKEILNLLQDRWSSWEDLNREIGNYFFLTYGMIFKEELIIFPVAWETVEQKYWDDMHVKSFEFSFPFIETPERPEIIVKHDNWDLGSVFVTDTGTLNFEQLEALFGSLPMDITVVDENDRVAYFTHSKDRIFPRSSAIIGRLVQNCHPPESVHVVEEIIETFRKGEKDKAVFWINAKGKKLLIQYFAMRNKKGEYKGVLETTQDITEIQSLEGEKRLLNWRDND